MSNLSDLIPAGGGQNNTDFVADGGIASGKPVILTAAGKAAEVGPVSQSSSLGAKAEFDAQEPSYVSCAYDSDTGVSVIAYGDSGNSNYGTCRVVTITGSSLTYGTVSVFDSVFCDYISISYNPTEQKMVIAYRNDGTGKGYAVLGTVSGTDITFGTPAEVSTSPNYKTTSFYDSTENKSGVLYGWDAGGSYQYPYGRVCNISGTTLTFGTAVRIESSGGEVQGRDFGVAHDVAEGKTCCLWRTAGYGRYAVATISGTDTISFGTYGNFLSEAMSESPAATYDAGTSKVVGVFAVSSDGYLHYIVGSVSGTGMSWGTEAAANALNSEYPVMAYDSSVQKEIILYAYDAGPTTAPYVFEGTVSGTTMTFSAATEVQTTDARNNMGMCFDATAGQSILGWRDSTGANGQARTYTSSGNVTNLTATNLLGIASGAILDTATGTINTWGSRNEVQTSLTIASDYYAQEDGTITTSDGGQLLGKALSATQINIKDYTG